MRFRPSGWFQGTVRGFANPLALVFGGIAALLGGPLSSPALSSHLYYPGPQSAAVGRANAQSDAPQFDNGLATSSTGSPAASPSSSRISPKAVGTVSPYATRADLSALALAMTQALAAQGQRSGNFVDDAAYQSLERAASDSARSVGLIESGAEVIAATAIPNLSATYLATSGGTVSGTLNVSNLQASTTSYTTLSVTNSIETNATSTNSFAGFAQSFTTQKVTTDQLCVADVCVTRDQFLRMVETSGQTPTTPDQTGQGSVQPSDASSTAAASSDTGADASSTPSAPDTTASTSPDQSSPDPVGQSSDASSTPAS
jgi:hypothetical protein